MPYVYVANKRSLNRGLNTFKLECYNVAMFTINPLSIIKCRQLHEMPKHFHTTTIQPTWIVTSVDITNWIESTDNLSGRYCVIQKLANINNSMILALQVGFESASDLTLFLFTCPLLKENHV